MSWQQLLAQGISDQINIGNQWLTNIWNKKQNEQLMREMWHRDDTAVQRRVADLKAAGINPLLAAGQAATTSSPIPVRGEAGKIGNAGEAVLAAMRMKKEFAMSDAQIELLKQQARKESAHADVAEWEAEWGETGGLTYRALKLEAEIRDISKRAEHTEVGTNRLREEFMELVDPTHRLYGPARDKLRADIQNVLSDTDLKDLDFRKLSRELAIIEVMGYITVPTGDIGQAAQFANVIINAIERSKYR